MTDSVLTRDGPVSVPLDYTVPGAGELLPLMVTATMDGTSAASAFYAAVQIIAPSGRIMGSAVSSTIAAGASASVSWFPYVVGVTSAAAVNFVGARIEATSTQAIPSGSATDLVYQTVAFDTGGMANLVADPRILTVKTPGLYLVACETDWPKSSGAPGLRHIAINKNNYPSGGFVGIADDQRPAIWDGLTGTGPNPHTTTAAVAIVKAAAGDFFSSGGDQDSGGALTIAGGPESFLSAILLGAG